MSRRLIPLAVALVAGCIIVAQSLRPSVTVIVKRAVPDDVMIASGTANTTAKFTGIAALANGWALDDGTTWGVASKFTIGEVTGDIHAFGTGTIDGAFVGGSTGSFGGALNMNSNRITGLADPSLSQDAMTLAYANSHYSTGGVTSSTLTANTIPKATGAAAIGNSLLTEDATTLSYNAGKFTVLALNGNSSIAGTLGVTGLATLTAGFTLGADSSANTHKITNLTNGASAQDAAAFGQLATAVNGAVSGTSGTMARFTGTNTIGNAWPLDDGTTWGVASKFTITEASGNFRAFGTGTIDGAFVGSSTGSLGGALNMTNHLINNVTDPVSAQDAMTLAYANSHYTTGGVSSSTLTANTIPKATGAAAIGNSLLTDDATTLSYNAGKFTVLALNGNSTIAGTLGVTGLATLTAGFTLGADSSANTHKITNLTNGASAQDAAAFGQLATAVNGAVSGTSGTMAKFTGTNTVGNSLLTDDATTLSYNAGKFTVLALNGNSTIAGTLGVTGLATLTAGFTLGADSSANTHKITNLTNGASAQDAAAFGQIATAVNTAVVGTSGTTPKFTGTNAIGNAWALDNGTTWGVSGKFTITEASGNTTVTGTLGVTGAATFTSATFSAGTTQAAISNTTIVAPSIAGAQNNYNPTNIATASVLYLTASADVSITGLISTACTAGRVITIMNTTAFNATFVHGSASSTRPFHNIGGSDVVLESASAWGPAGEVSSVTYRCNTTTSTWDMIDITSPIFPVLEVTGRAFFDGAVTIQNNVLTLATEHVITNGTPATLSCNGTGAAATCAGLACNDVAGTITTNTGATACTVTFVSTWSSIPTCTVSTGAPVATPAYISARSATAITITFPALSASTVDYICIGHQ